MILQAGAELCQARVKLEVVVEVESIVEVDACHFQTRWVGGQEKTKLILISIQIEVVVKVEVELGKNVFF